MPAACLRRSSASCPPWSRAWCCHRRLCFCVLTLLGFPVNNFPKNIFGLFVPRRPCHSSGVGIQLACHLLEYSWPWVCPPCARARERRGGGCALFPLLGGRGCVRWCRSFLGTWCPQRGVWISSLVSLPLSRPLRRYSVCLPWSPSWKRWTVRRLHEQLMLSLMWHAASPYCWATHRPPSRFPPRSGGDLPLRAQTRVASSRLAQGRPPPGLESKHPPAPGAAPERAPKSLSLSLSLPLLSLGHRGRSRPPGFKARPQVFCRCWGVTNEHKSLEG